MGGPLNKALRYVEHGMDCIEIRTEPENRHALVQYLYHVLQKVHVALLEDQESDWAEDFTEGFTDE